MASLSENVAQAISDFGGIKTALIEKGVSVPNGTPTSRYGQKISSIITYETDLRNIIQNDSYFTFEFPPGITQVRDNFFFNCSKLYGVTIPNSVARLGESVFANCYSLNNVIIPGSVTFIGVSAFYQCFSLNDLTISNGVQTISSAAFHSCTGLISVKIPDSVTSIGSMAFWGCAILSTVDLTDFTNPNSLPSLAATSAFGNNRADRQFIVANAEMLAAFSAATNWSTFASDFEIQGA